MERRRYSYFFTYILLFSLGFSCLLKAGEFKTRVRVLDEENWEDMLVGEWMVEFYAPWCPACQQLASIWAEFSGWSDDLGIKVASVDVTANPGLSGRFAITALPTIFHVKDGVFRQYRSPKSKEGLFSFIEEEKWRDMDPIPSWKAPQSIQMGSLAYFFKLSMLLRNVHNFMIDAGIPYWGSYAVFGIGTILFGAILGLIIVCIIDLLSPTKKLISQQQPKKKENAEQEVDEKDQVESEDPDTDMDVIKGLVDSDIVAEELINLIREIPIGVDENIERPAADLSSLLTDGIPEESSEEDEIAKDQALRKRGKGRYADRRRDDKSKSEDR